MPADIFDEVESVGTKDIFDDVAASPPSSPTAQKPAGLFHRRSGSSGIVPPAPRPWYVPTSMDVMPTSYSPGSGPTFAPTPGSGEIGEGEASASNEAKQQGLETAFGIHGYPKIVSGVKKVVKTGVLRTGSTYYTPPQVTPTDEQSKELASGTAEALQGVGEASTPLIAEAAGAKPITTGLGFLAGYGASKGAGAIAHERTTPENEELIRQLAFWAPGLAATAFRGVAAPETITTSGPGVKGRATSIFGGKVGYVAGITPDEAAVGVKVGPYEGSVRIPRTPPEAMQPTPSEQALLDNKIIKARAANVQQGKPAVTPPPPPPGPEPPPDVAQGHISPETVQGIGEALAKLPPNLRAQGMLEAHGTLSRVLQQQGKVVLPSGQIAVIDSPKSADKIATDLINAEVERQDSLSKATKSADEKPAAVTSKNTPAAVAGEQTARVTRKQRAAELNSQAPLRVVGVESASESANGSGAVSEVGKGAVVQPEAGGTNAGAVSGEVLSKSAQASPAGREENVLRVVGEEEAGVEPNDATAKIGAAETDANERAKISATDSGNPSSREGTSAPAFEKGDKVTLADGRSGTIEYIHPTMSIVRGRTDDGAKFTIGKSKLKLLAHEGKEPSLPKPAVTHVNRAKYASTQVNLPKEHADKVIAAGKKLISDEELMGDGRETEPHITVKYGVHEREDDLAAALAKHEPFTAKLGRLHVFPPSKHSDGASPVVAEVESPELGKLHNTIHEAISAKDDDFKYKPHVTLAYVKPEAAEKYKGSDALAGTTIPVDHVTLSRADRSQKKFPLGVPGESKVPERYHFISDDLGKVEKAYDKLGTPNYVAADKAKELLPEWADVKKRAGLEYPAHEASSQLAYRIYKQKLARLKPGSSVLFVTGPVAAGKSSAVKMGNASGNDLTYEVNLSDYGMAKKRVDEALAQGLKPKILYAYTTPELSAERRAVRALDEHRPVNIDRSTTQHLDLPHTIEKLNKEYGNKVDIEIVDNSKPGGTFVPVEKVGELAYPKGRNELLSDQQRVLDKLRADDTIGPELHSQLSSREISKGDEGSDSKESARSSAGSGTQESRAGKSEAAEVTPSKENLLTGESGSFEPGKISDALAKAAGPIGEYLRSEISNNKIARELHAGMNDLESQYSADVLRAVHTMGATLKEAGPEANEIFKGIYHHMEDPEGHPLTKEQDKFFDDIVIPIAEDTNEKFARLESILGKNEVGLLDNYVHRVVKGKGSFFDRILKGMKGTGRGNLLTKTSPQTKSRKMMAIERIDGGKTYRYVVSVKGGQVTAWLDGKPSNLGGISHTDDGKAWTDKDGNNWTLTQATTKEIEASTDLRYYHNALASSLISNLQVRKALRGAEFINDFKNSDEFSNIAMKIGKGVPPEGWRQTNLPQMRDYYFEPHTAEVLDWYATRIRGQDPNIFDKLGGFLRTSIFFNPLIHTPNIAIHWAAEKGPSGYIPTTGGMRTYRTSIKAINAVIHQNQDFLDALDAGAPLQSQREDTAKLTQLFFDQLTDGLEKKEDWAAKIAKTVGMAPVDLVKAIYKFSGKATWLTNDIAFLQSTYEKVEQGMDLKTALRETGKHIPDYRLPVRMLNSAGLAKILSNNAITMFMAYHYGALKSYGEMAKSALGANEPPPGSGRSKAGEVAHGWELLAGVGLITFLLYPLIADEVAKKVTGDKNAKFRRAGAATFPYNAYMLATHQKSASEVAQSIATPAVGTKTAAELLANRDFYSGRQIYDPHATWQDEAEQVGRKLTEAVSPVGQAVRSYEDAGQRKRALWGMVGISFPKTRAEKMEEDKREGYYERKHALDALRKGDSKPLDGALQSGKISREQAHRIEQRARLTPLQDSVHQFSYSEIMQVYNVADEKEKQEIEPIIRQKRSRMLAAHRGAEVTAVESSNQ